MKAVIIEDEPLAVERLEKMLKEVAVDIEIVARLSSVAASIEWLKKHSCDVIFLDIQLSDGLSFSIFEHVQCNTPIIFTTAYDKYALKAFELNSIAYLLKPVKRTEIALSLSKLNALKTSFQIDFETILQEMKGGTFFKKRFLIQVADILKKIEIDEIAYFYASEKMVFLKTVQGRSYPVEYTLDQLERCLDPEHFFRINRKYLVHLKSIANMQLWSTRRIKLTLTPPADEAMDTLVSLERVGDFKRWMNR